MSTVECSRCKTSKTLVNFMKKDKQLKTCEECRLKSRPKLPSKRCEVGEPASSEVRDCPPEIKMMLEHIDARFDELKRLIEKISEQLDESDSE